jgi:hypothetical protein
MAVAVPGPIRTGEWNSYITGLSKDHVVPRKNLESDIPKWSPIHVLTRHDVT